MKTRRMLSLLAVVLALTASLVTAAPAQAAQPTTLTDGSASALTNKGQPSPTGIAAMAWTPSMSPFYSPAEFAGRDMSTEERNYWLNNCPPQDACVAVGEGNGLHTVFFITRCDQRTLSNFIGDGAVTNTQIDNAQVVLKYQDGTKVRTIDANSKPTPVRVDWDPIYYLDPC
ncbi:hypothetical protein [Amycolatopsis sp. WQ 127309]|uniref:hypothetical protein n=1 Tax=Amycolatopsis sp. WQ 127309 TaxID=2932773 RepID=UPI001FF6762E|nr:hypothetical protein [Amycolatopsis sp. WQ 127309]UOZ05573.1 hypothetical protein MUY22_43220 [Amycolatopsis sp. WQ 127309]